MPAETTPSRHRGVTDYRKQPLIFRAGIARAFASLGGFLAVVFLGAGVYLLQEVFTDPLRAQSFSLISGAVVIALAAILIYFILAPLKKSRSSKARRRSQPRAAAPAFIVAAPASSAAIAAAHQERGKDLAVHA